ncbi:peroxynitrite isomerase THAP4-like [Plodia interpunctella]|uniref:peroxynitrite isomerase THAP4-like n=1 Tax=Plodia interpunctella TaxID=58824 RepID=UPI0023676CDC|nr:peroxynitrite isomerase THAP4-like [Plodia interpunctella]XP_053618947.1 peroxynitrite isomerase THAP4-like [Plodia interpunctella]
MEGIHEALTPISWLSGRWSTKDGHGTYPNISDFKYHEDIEFICIGQPMYNFSSLSKHPEKQTPMHQERGFLRIKPGTNELAFMVSHNFGLTSHEEGTCDVEKKEIVLETVTINRMSFAKPPVVKKFKRIMKLVMPDTLEVTLFMETENTPLSEHLKAVYKKVEG